MHKVSGSPRGGSGVFRIRTERPAARIQEVFEREAALRGNRAFPQWIDLELLAVWTATNEERARLGKGPVSLEAVRRVDRGACGHIDYSIKLALGCEELVYE